MSVFEYVCDNCGTEFEVLVKIEEETTCPVCDGTSHTLKPNRFGIPKNPVRVPCSSGGCGSCLDEGNCASGSCC